MLQHLKIVASLHVFNGIVLGAAGLFLLIGGVIDYYPTPQRGFSLGEGLRQIGVRVVTVFSIPLIIVGIAETIIGLSGFTARKRWARTGLLIASAALVLGVTMILKASDRQTIPALLVVGWWTMLAGYSVVVLQSKDVRRLFLRDAPLPVER